MRTAIKGSDIRPAVWRPRLLACLAALTFACAFVPSAVLAADDDDDEESIETKFIKGLFGIGDKDSINYRERPPLVVPPNLGRLPTPETNAAVKTPAWPKDPEAVERKKRAQAKKNQRPRTDHDDDRPLTPGELAAGRKAGGGVQSTAAGPEDLGTQSDRPRRPDELGYKGGLFNSLFKDNSKPEVATFGGEPARNDLTKPPPGYQTPSAAQPYGLTPRKERAKPLDISKRGDGD